MFHRALLVAAFASLLGPTVPTSADSAYVCGHTQAECEESASPTAAFPSCTSRTFCSGDGCMRLCSTSQAPDYDPRTFVFAARADDLDTITSTFKSPTVALLASRSIHYSHAGPTTGSVTTKTGDTYRFTGDVFFTPDGELEATYEVLEHPRLHRVTVEHRPKSDTFSIEVASLDGTAQSESFDVKR
ncbi:MAG: hypothetical protein AAGM22_30725 [Acidobacteriota bacterium]